MEPTSPSATDIKSLKRLVLVLMAYALLATAAAVAFCWGLLHGKITFQTVTAQQVKVVEPGGMVKLALFNREHLPAAEVNGVKLPRSGGGESGLMFYNEEGVECGGLIYSGALEHGMPNSGMSLTFDKYQQDQVVQLEHEQYPDSGMAKELSALLIFDRPDIPIDQTFHVLDSIRKSDPAGQHGALEKFRDQGGLGFRRLLVGKRVDKRTGVFINDAQGRPRLEIFVDKDGNPKIVFYDEKGKPTVEGPGENVLSSPASPASTTAPHSPSIRP